MSTIDKPHWINITGWHKVCVLILIMALRRTSPQHFRTELRGFLKQA